nr:unnamed protein product [Naegleria fowleri]
MSSSQLHATSSPKIPVNGPRGSLKQNSQTTSIALNGKRSASSSSSSVSTSLMNSNSQHHSHASKIGSQSLPHATPSTIATKKKSPNDSQHVLLLPDQPSVPSLPIKEIPSCTSNSALEDHSLGIECSPKNMKNESSCKESKSTSTCPTHSSSTTKTAPSIPQPPPFLLTTPRESVQTQHDEQAPHEHVHSNVSNSALLSNKSSSSSRSPPPSLQSPRPPISVSPAPTETTTTTTSTTTVPYKPPLKKDDLIWVDIKDKYYLAKVTGMIKNVQVIYNERSLSNAQEFTKNDQVDLSKCFHVDLVSLNDHLEKRENLLWISPGCHSLPQIAQTWLSVVNKSYEDQKRSSQIFTMHMGERNILLKNPDFSFLNKTHAQAIKRNGQDLVDYTQTQLRLHSAPHCLNLVLLGEGSKEKQVTLQQVIMSLLHKNLLPHVGHCGEKEELQLESPLSLPLNPSSSSSTLLSAEDYVKEIRVTVGSALNLLLIFSNHLYEKALTQTHMRKVVLSCDSQANRINDMRIHSIARERILSTISNDNGSQQRNLPLYQIFLLMISGGEDLEHHVVADMNHYKLFQKHKVNYKDLNFMKMDLGKLNSYFSKFGISSEETDLVYRILSACMWIYNLEFSSSQEGVSSSENSETLRVVSELLGLSQRQCESIFTNSNKVNLMFDYMYGAVLHFIENRINERLHALITEWRSSESINVNTTSFGNSKTPMKEICIIDLPAATENHNLSDQFLDLFNAMANETNLLNELSLIEQVLHKDQLYQVDHILSSFSHSIPIEHSWSEMEWMHRLRPLSEESIHTLCDEISQAHSLKSLFHDERTLWNDYDRTLGQEYLKRVAQHFMNSLLSPTLETKSFFIHCMTFSIEKKTSNAVFNQCISSLKTTGFHHLLNLYAGNDKYNYKMSRENFSQHFEAYFRSSIEITTTGDGHSRDSSFPPLIMKGTEFVYFQDSTLLRVLESMKNLEDEKISLLASLHFVTDEFHDLFENKRVRMENIFTSESCEETNERNDNDDNDDEEEEEKKNESTSLNPQQKDFLFENPLQSLAHHQENLLEHEIMMTEDHRAFMMCDIPEQELPYHSACLGLTAFSNYLSPLSCEEGRQVPSCPLQSPLNQSSLLKISQPLQQQQLLLQRRLSSNSIDSRRSSLGNHPHSSPLKAIQCVHKCRSQEGATSFMFDSVEAMNALDFRDSSKMVVPSPSSTLKSNRLRMKQVVILEHGRSLKQLKPDFTKLSRIQQVQISQHTKLMIESLSEQLEDYDNSNVLEVRPKQMSAFVTFVADYWFTYMHDEKNTLSFLKSSSERSNTSDENLNHEVLSCLLECFKLLNFVMTFSRQRTEVVKSIRSEGLLIMLCESAIRLHFNRENRNDSFMNEWMDEDFKSPELLLFQQLIVLTIMNCVKHDKMTCGFIVQEHLFWSFFECLCSQHDEWKNDKKNSSLWSSFSSMTSSSSSNSSSSTTAVITDDVRKVLNLLSKYYMEILSLLISDPHSYQFLNVQVKDTLSNGTLQNVKSTLSRSISGHLSQLKLTPLLNAQFYKEVAQQMILLIQNHDKNNEQVKVFVTFIQHAVPLLSFNSSLILMILQEWIAQMQVRSIHFVCQGLRALGKIHEKLRQEQGTASKLLGLVFSNRDGILGQVMEKTALFEILKTRILHLYEEQVSSSFEMNESIILMEEEFPNRNQFGNETSAKPLSSSSLQRAPLESLVYALMYLCVLYPNVRVKFVEFVFSSSKENWFPNSKATNNNNKNHMRMMNGLELEDLLSKENIEQRLSKLDSSPKEFSQFSQHLAKHLAQMQTTTSSKIGSHVKKAFNQYLERNTGKEWSNTSQWSVHSLLHGDYSQQNLTTSF